MSDVKAIRAGIAANLETIVGKKRVRATVPDQVEPPMIVVGPRTPGFGVRESMEGGAGVLWRWPFRLFVIASRADYRTAQDTLDEFVSTVGDRSVRQALKVDQSLGGAADNVLYEGVTLYGLEEQIAGAAYAAAVIDITVRSRG